MWKMVLTSQFHDIIPGSSIDLVYQIRTRTTRMCWGQAQPAQPGAVSLLGASQ
jgi:hypothetical protein